MLIMKVYSLIPAIALAFIILSHALSFVSQVLQDLGKQTPGWFGTAQTEIGKAIAFLNGVRPAAPQVDAQGK